MKKFLAFLALAAAILAPTAALSAEYGYGTVKSVSKNEITLTEYDYDKDEDADVRAGAAQALGALRAEVAVPGLLESLKNQKWPVRRNAAVALGVLRAEAAIEALVQYANRWKGDDLERVAAIRSLHRIAETPSVAARDGRSRPSG